MTDKESNSFMNPQFLNNFIDAYRNYPCLWKVKSDEYLNRNKREEALNNLILITQETIPTADLKFIRSKIDSMKNSFRREYKKVKESSKSGASEDSVYVPRLWYYNSLLFLADHETHNPSTSNLDEETHPVENHPEDDQHDENQNESQVLEHSRTPKSFVRPGMKRKRVDTPKTQRQKLMSKAMFTLEKEDDEYDIFGKLVASKLRKMSQGQSLYSEKLITEVLHAGLQDKLADHTYLHNHPQHQYSPVDLHSTSSSTYFGSGTAATSPPLESSAAASTSGLQLEDLSHPRDVNEYRFHSLSTDA